VIVAWRICESRFAATAFDSRGAALYPRRWNTSGTRAVYLAESRFLAVLAASEPFSFDAKLL